MWTKLCRQSTIGVFCGQEAGWLFLAAQQFTINVICCSVQKGKVASFRGNERSNEQDNIFWDIDAVPAA